MKPFYLIAFGLMTTLLVACGGAKVVNKSSKKKPGWTESIAQGYIIAKGAAYSRDEAQSRALVKVNEEIVNSIAVQVVSTSSMSSNEETVNNVSSFIDDFSSNTEVTSEYFEAIKGISVNKVEDFYWEEVKQDGSTKFYYYMKYPFSQSELNALISDYERVSAEQRAEIKKVTDREGPYASVEDIFADIKQLEYLQEISTNRNADLAKERKDLLEDMILDIKVTRVLDSLGVIEYALKLYGEHITTEQTPIINSNCKVSIRKVKEYRDYTQVLYDVQRCTGSKGNYISVGYDFDGFDVEQYFPISNQHNR